ncbi:uncharacterized protein YfaP (DUF2135 family) [Variovorax boronicumulans]|uniref:carboxypeptidase regulatory-like domain-containing protein n=1 Tax=Variovorax boronicumulans TaxID=436515 RepID=UPI002784724B|nr:carboxypeptidase regulatory-like domain-containing protein [Variovorax boronicumulans]MDQ0083562.1 uncharacterized protein YfaP (DUF2135 family) [Variovorax boronicumulans]
MKTRMFFAALAAAVALVACGGSDGGAGFVTLPPPDQNAPPPPPPPPPQQTNAKVSGRVTNALDGQGVAQVTVAAAGVSAVTGDDGSYSLAEIPPNASVLLSFSKAGMVPQSRATAALSGSGASTVVNVPMLPVAVTETFDGQSAHDVVVPGSTAMVRVSANSLRRPDGSAPGGLVTARVTPIAPASDVNVMPGNYLAATDGGSAPMESFGALDASFTDADGTPLNLAAGTSATVRIAPSSRAGTLPPSVPLFFYNTATGLWVQEGSATLQGTAPNQYYEGTVTHFTTWNADQIYNTVRINGCVQDATGARVAGALVASEGKSYTGQATALTNANGEFSVAVKRTSSAFVVATTASEISNAPTVNVADEDVPLGSCLELTRSALSIKLTWGERPRDLDSHTLGANADEHVYYSDKGSLAAAPFIALDVDDVDSFGPEVTTFAKLAKNRTYRFYIRNFSGTFDPGQTGSPARVEVSNRGAQTVFSPPAGESNSTDYWHVFDVRTDEACNASIVPVQQFLADPPVSLDTSGNAQYCN